MAGGLAVVWRRFRGRVCTRRDLCGQDPARVRNRATSPSSSPRSSSWSSTSRPRRPSASRSRQRCSRGRMRCFNEQGRPRPCLRPPCRPARRRGRDSVGPCRPSGPRRRASLLRDRIQSEAWPSGAGPSRRCLRGVGGPGAARRFPGCTGGRPRVHEPARRGHPCRRIRSSPRRSRGGAKGSDRVYHTG